MAFVCRVCGTPITPGAKFCGNCGTATGAMSQQSEPGYIAQEVSKQYAVQHLPPGKESRFFPQQWFGFFLFLSLFFFFGGSDLFCMIKMERSKAFLDPAQVSLYGAISVVLVFIFFVPVLACLSVKKGKKRDILLRLLAASLPTMAGIGFVYRTNALILSMTLENVADGQLPIRFFLALGSYLLFLLGIYLSVGQVSTERRPNLLWLLLSFLGHIPKVLLWLISLVALFWGTAAAGMIAASALRPAGLDPTAYLGLILAECLTATAGFRLLILSIYKSVGKWFSQREQKRIAKTKMVAPEDGKGALRSIPYLISCGIMFFGSMLLIFLPVNVVQEEQDRLFSEIDLIVMEASAEMLMERSAGAEQLYQEAAQRLKALDALCNDRPEEIERMIREGTEDAVIWQCYLACNKDAVPELEHYVMENADTVGEELLELLFTAYGSMRSKDVKEDYAEELLQHFLLTRQYVAWLAELPDSDREKAKLSKALEKYSYVAAIAEGVHELNQVGREGGVTSDIVYGIQRTAENYPDELMVQYIAGLLTAGGAGDSMHSTYAAGIQCVQRFLELSEADRDVDEEEMDVRRTAAIQLMMRMEGYEEALAVAGEISKPDQALEEQLAATCLNIYYKNGDMERLNRKVKEMLDDGNNAPACWYYYGISSQELENYDASIRSMEQLVEIVQDSSVSGQELYITEQYLYILMEFAVMNENGILGNSYFYQNMSEEEKSTLSPMLYDYLEAMKDYVNFQWEEANTHVDAVLSRRDDLAFAWYLKGMIGYGSQDFDQAIDCFQKALAFESQNLTFLYALANAYDGAERYTEAYAVSAMVEELLPQQDHNSDPFGIGFHNPWLREKLESYVNGGEE